ncbi:MAG: hypothetical protein H6807_00810 [Planctomycetes bacterium]|nr:hypothetical protein [Planctomycetota bacterium]
MMSGFDSMIMADVALRGLVLALAAFLGCRLLGRDAAAARHGLALAALVLLLLLPLGLLLGGPSVHLYERELPPVAELVLEPVAPIFLEDDFAISRRILRPEEFDAGAFAPADAPAPDDSETSGAASPNEAGSPVTPALAAAAPVPASTGGAVDWSTWGPILAWALGALVVALRWLVTRRRLRQLLRASARPDVALSRLVARVAKRAGLVRAPRIHVCPGLDSPAVTGILMPRLLLPADVASELDQRLLEPIVLHEMVHLRRRDPLLQALARLVGFLHWFNPFARLLRASLERDRELLTDARVVALEAHRSPYAEGLLRVVSRGVRGPLRPVAALGLCDGESLRDRLARIVRGDTVRPGSRWVLGTLTLVVLVCGLLVGEVGLAGVVMGRGPSRQDEERVEATLRVFVLPAADRDDGKSFRIKDRRLDLDELKATLARYSVMADEKYDDGRGLSSTRVIVELSEDDQRDDLKALLRICADLRIYRNELRDPQPRPRARRGLVVDLDDEGRLRLGPDGSFDPVQDVDAILTAVRERLRTDETPILRSAPGVDHRRVIKALELMRRAGADRVTFETRVPDGDENALSEQRRAALRRATPQDSIEPALDYLRRRQDARGAVTEPELGDGGRHDVGRTALALLAYLGAGSTDQAGPYRKVVARAVDFLLAQQAKDGFIGDSTGVDTVYDHALAGLALAELQGLTRSPRLERPLAAAVSYVLEAQNPYRGWRYGKRDGDNDTAVTTWMLMFLKSARAAGVEVPELAFEYAEGYLEEMIDPNTGRAGYIRPGGQQPVSATDGKATGTRAQVETTTAMVNFGLVLCGRKPNDPLIERGRGLLRAAPPSWDPVGGRVDYVYWYFGCLANYQAGGSDWVGWDEHLRDALVGRQVEEGDLAGSWDPIGIWGKECGRVAATALATLALEVSWRYGRAVGIRPVERKKD